MSDQEIQEKRLRDFITDPQATYTFDSERGSFKSELCREAGPANARDCITLAMQSTKLFQAMQAQGFFCALPMDPARTYIECKRLPK